MKFKNLKIVNLKIFCIVYLLSLVLKLFNRKISQKWPDFQNRFVYIKIKFNVFLKEMSKFGYFKKWKKSEKLEWLMKLKSQKHLAQKIEQ